MLTMIPKIPPWDSAPITLCMGDNPDSLLMSSSDLPIDVTLGLTPKPVAMPTSTKYIQKLREHIRWACKKADLFQRELWHPQYRKHSPDLVHVTAFKGRQKIQNRWESREYVVEWQPYPNLPVYVVHPMDWEGCSQILHRNYLLPINNNLKQAEDENSVDGVEPIDEPTPMPQAYNELPADSQAKHQLASLHNLPPRQCELTDPEVTRLATPDPAKDRPQAGQDQHAPLR